MKNRFLCLFVIATVRAAGCVAPPPESTALTEEDVAAIRGSVAELVQLFLADAWDGDAVANLWTENGMLMPPNAPPIVGRVNILAMYQTFTVTEFTMIPLEIDGRDGLAYVRGEYSSTLTVEDVDEPISGSGKWINLWRKQSDGTWLMTHEIWNSNGE
ncbi:MAG: YybH family protein [Bacteroidota bacterium]